MTMSASNASAMGAPQASAQDMQNLASLLGNIMPLLLRMQPPPSAQPETASMFGNPMVDHQAAVSLAEDITADCLRRLSSYLERNAPHHAGLESCVAIVTQAAQCFSVRNYAHTFELIMQAYRTVTALRMANPQLPPLHGIEHASEPSHAGAQIH